jgi:hypothetical protein
MPLVKYRELYLVFSLAFLSFPYLLYGFLVGWDPLWGFRIGVGVMGFGYYLYLVAQIAYYACGLPPRYLALSTVIFVAYFFSMSSPELMVLLLIGFVYSVVIALYFGMKSGVFVGWLNAFAWLFLWNLVGGIVSIPAHVYFGRRDIWLWWKEPPADPLYALAVGVAGITSTWALGKIRLLVKRKC